MRFYPSLSLQRQAPVRHMSQLTRWRRLTDSNCGTFAPVPKYGLVRLRSFREPLTSRRLHSDPSVSGSIMEKRMEATIVYWGDMGIMEKKTETSY